MSANIRCGLAAVSQWPAMGLNGQVILEAGSGAGRFTELLLETGAIIVSFDFSRAVETTRVSDGDHPALLLAWHEEAGVYGIEVLPGSNGLIGRGVC